MGIVNLFDLVLVFVHDFLKIYKWGPWCSMIYSLVSTNIFVTKVE